MPGFAQRLSDQEVAELASFLRQGWSNEASVVSAEAVAKVRATLDTHGDKVLKPSDKE
jgi:mono/diheme cytochrome c family protein